ncbi:trihelix transcription factor ASR3 isoform X1 [Eutrema salsugineum]|uniref:mRNA, clone: RTFL01-44-G06 n=1 Tax=Eutrema halophilum TaxID=98038 RepID=E4MY76_EUTHA|nr:trihelix transcription factor ASR3 isoform X1 [Eutrema salsugineum]BAJ34559.1 unnamed protein product [Eutrema halophilum]
MADQSGGLVMMREYRKGNWTLNETMVLIEAKKMDDERRMRRSIGLPPPEMQQDSRSSSNKPAELRWKWIEDYCWRKGCMRSQNQCNDKWDNLMRDYKKVREYERRRVESSFASSSSSSSAAETGSYWSMEKSERKERNLPSNMLPQTYQALYEVVESKTLPSSTAATAVTAAVAAAAAAIGSGNGSSGGLEIQKAIQQQQQQGLGSVVPKHQMTIQPPPVILPLQPPPSQPPQPLPRPLLLPPPPPPSFHAQPILPTVEG